MLSFEILLAIASFAFVTSITPGPNNVMLTASGANFGFVRTLPHIAGIVVGFILLIVGVGLGLGELFLQFPLMHQLLKIIGSAYLMWLAYKLLNFSYTEDENGGKGKPFTFFQAFIFQYVNPKAWIIAISANSTFGLPGDQYLFSVGVVGLVFVLVNPFSIMVWAGFGHMIRRYLKQAAFLKAFNILMASLTAACVLIIWLD